MRDTQTQVAEIVTFRLIDGASRADFLSAAKGMEPFLKGTGAMIRRTLCEADDGTWTDHIIWTDMQSAKTAAQDIMQRPEAGPFMALIAPDDVQMRHAIIHLQQE